MTWTTDPIPGGGWAFTSPDHQAKITLEYLIPIGRGLEGWVECTVGDTEIPVASGRRDLTTADAAAPFLRQLGDSEIPWATGLKEAFYFAIKADREGAATLDLSTVEPQGLVYLVEPLLEQGGSTRLIAPGGAGKSIMAMALALTVATGSREFLGLHPQVTGPVLYLDWETNADTHAQRIRALCEPAGVSLPGRDMIFYRNERVPLARSLQAVHRAARASQAVLLIVDSAKMAAGPSGQSSGEEATLGLYLALREIGLPALIIDHKSKDDIAKKRTGGYGNVFMENLARLQWEFTALTQVSSTEKRFVLALTKENNTGSQPPLGFALETKGGDHGLISATYRRMSVDAIRSQSDDSDLGERVLLLFATSSEPLTVDRIAELVGTGKGSLRAMLNRDKRFFNVNEGKKGKTGLWRPIEELLSGPTDDGIQDSLDTGPISDWREGDEVY